MLTSLSIRNLAIIENIDLSLKDGFTVLTGGTGAGKSLLIDSLSLLLGARADNDLIRSGEDKATIIGKFIVNSPRLDGILSNLNIPILNHELNIERVISKTRSVIKVNGVSITLQDLNKISHILADIHSQFDVIKMLNPENYLDIIDGFAYEMVESFKSEYLTYLSTYKNVKHTYEELLEKKRKIEESREYLEYQLKELSAFKLRSGEEEEIASELAVMKNYDKYYSLFAEVDELIRSDALERIYDVLKGVEKLNDIQGQYGDIKDKLSNNYYEIDDLFETLKHDFKHLDYDPDRFNELMERDNEINNLKRKYHKSYEELISYRDELSSMIGEDSSIDEDVNHAKKEMLLAYSMTLQKGQELSAIRQNIAKSIKDDVMNNLADLLLKANFEISFKTFDDFNDSNFKDNGIDEVDFLIETNVGEGLKSMNKIISGGEASRIMLAFKTMFIKSNKISTVIFDEIDTGLSGEAAQAVAKKIKEISYLTQVIAITHMPQIAALGDHHILISKSVVDNRTHTNIKELNLEEKIYEIAHLISGNDVTEKQLDYAREMILKK